MSFESIRRQIGPIVLSIALGALALGCSDTSDEEGANNGATNNDATNNDATNNDATNNDTTNNTNTGTNPVDTRSPWAHLLIDDYTPVSISTKEPGADLDAIGLVKAGTEAPIWVKSIDESQVPSSDNDFADPIELVGAPDAECEQRRFVSLGGVNEPNFAIVTFGDLDSDAEIASGDQLEIFELGPASCPDGSFEDEAVELQISVSTSMQTWIAVGSWTTDGGALTVP